MQELGWVEVEAEGTDVATARVTEAGRAALGEQGLRLLRVFNAKAERLNRRGFLASFRAGNTGYDWHWRRGEEVRMERYLPNEDERDAYVLTLRLFVQDRDGFSFRRLERLYPHLGVAPDLVERVRAVRTRVNAYLDAPSQVILNHREPTRREIFEVFLYGGLAHTDPDKWAVFEAWREHAIQWPLVEESFTRTATQVTEGIFQMRRVNLDAIAQLESARGGDPVSA
jgi:hypothetical protein